MDEYEEILKVLETSLSQIKWRLKPPSKRRLQTDILALCTRMRPVIMVDYGGKMPELGKHLCAFLTQCKKESLIFEHLRVMVIDEMVYLIHCRELANFVKSTLNMEIVMHFVDLENEPLKMRRQTEETPALMQLLSAQKMFSSVFHEDGVVTDLLQSQGMDIVESSVQRHATPASLELVDLSCCLQQSQATIPTLNGWLLGYPVVYLFGIDHIDQAVYNLSTKSLQIYQIFVDRVDSSSKGYRQEELLSFTVPYDLSLGGSNEEWAKSFLAHMRSKWEKCKHVWKSLHMEVSACYPQAIAL